MRDLVQKLNRNQAADNPIHLEILADGDALISKESHERYLTGIHKIMQTAQDQATVQKLVQTSEFQDLKLSNAHALLLATEVLNNDPTISGGWLQDHSQDAVVFTPNSSIAEDLRTGRLRYVNMLEPVRRPCGEQQLIARSKVLLREQISKEGIAYINKDDIAFSSLWLQGLAGQLDGDLSELGIARASFTDLPSHIQSEVANLFTTHSPSDAIDGKHTNFLQTPCSRFGNLLISNKRRQSLEMALEQSARESAARQVESATAVPALDSTDALNGVLKNEKSLTSAEHNELRNGLLNREMNQRVRSLFEGELTRGYDTMRERFSSQYCDRILFKADLGHEFNKSLESHSDFAKILEETLETWVQETLIPQNLKPQSPLSRLAQQCNDKSLSRKLDALKTQWRGLEDLRTFPPQYRVAELVDNVDARRGAKEDLIRKQQAYLAKETKPLDGLLELLVILIARRTPGFAHARGKHIPRLIGLLEGMYHEDGNDAETQDLLRTLDQLKQRVKTGSATKDDVEQMRVVERKDAMRFAQSTSPNEAHHDRSPGE
ncbi:MAG: hypothetical protein Q9165_006246 [Trypethelium subeluteriae]